MKKCYISGPITGLDYQQAFEEFMKAETKLKDAGFEPINPMRLPHNHDKEWRSYMREDLIELLKCDCIFMLPNWYHSRGARLEFSVANDLGMELIRL